MGHLPGPPRRPRRRSWPTRSATPSAPGHRPPHPSGPKPSWPPTPCWPPKSPSSAPPTTSPPNDTRLLGPRQYAAVPHAIQQASNTTPAAHRAPPHPTPAASSSSSTPSTPASAQTATGPNWPPASPSRHQPPRPPHPRRHRRRQHPLPDELPAAALWWRLLRRPDLGATLDTTHTQLRPTWITDLHDVFGSAAAETITADPAWPAWSPRSPPPTPPNGPRAICSTSPPNTSPTPTPTTPSPPTNTPG